MAKIFTPLQSVVSVGLLKNQGLSTTTQLAESVNNFNSLAIPTASADLLAAGPSQEVLTSLLSLPGCLTGIVSPESRETVPDDISSLFNFDSLMSDVLSQSQQISSIDVKGIIDIMSAAEGFCVNSFNMLGTFRAMQDTSYDDFGVTIRNYNDIMTGGVTSQFGDNIDDIDSQGFRSLMEQMSKFGSMYDVTQLSRLDDPRVLVQNLLNQGFYQISDALAEKGIETTDIFEVSPQLMQEVLKSISGPDLVNIVSVTKFNSYRPIFSLADVLNAERVFDPLALSMAGGSFKELARKLSNIGGIFDSFEDLSNTYRAIQSVNIPNLTSLLTLSNQGPNNIFDDDFPELGIGSGIYGNPTIYDVIGSLSGSDYVKNINQLIDTHQNISSSIEISNLLSAIEDAVANPSNSSSALAIDNARTQLENSNLGNTILDSQLIFQKIFDNLFNERYNSYIAGISIVDSSGTVQGLTAFVLDLHRVHQDPMGLRYREFIESLATQDTYGEAILATIAEGNNISVLNDRGIPSYTGIDPIDFQTRLINKPC